MAHTSIKPIWKYSWKPEGYGSEIIELDTSSSNIGTFIKLDHTFFRGKEFNAKAGNAELTVGYENQTLTGKEDLVLRLYDAKLSQLSDSGVYRAIEITSKRAKVKNLTLQVNFIADVIDPADFGQPLNEDADVIHKSISVKEAKAEHIFVEIATLQNSFEGEWGKIDKDKVVFTAALLETFGMSVSGGKLTFHEPLELKTGEKGLIRFDPETFLWEVWNVRSNKYTPVIISHEAAKDIPAGAIPLVAGDDPAAQSYVDWFKVDPAKKALCVPSLITDGLDIDSETGVIKTKGFAWGNHTFRILDDGTLDIDNLLQINNSTGLVRIGNVVFDKSLLAALRKIAKKTTEDNE